MSPRNDPPELPINYERPNEDVFLSLEVTCTVAKSIVIGFESRFWSRILSMSNCIFSKKFSNNQCNSPQLGCNAKKYNKNNKNSPSWKRFNKIYSELHNQADLTRKKLKFNLPDSSNIPMQQTAAAGRAPADEVIDEMGT